MDIDKMCDKESFAKIRDAICELQKADAVQSEQIKTLFLVTERQGDTRRACERHGNGMFPR